MNKTLTNNLIIGVFVEGGEGAVRKTRGCFVQAVVLRPLTTFSWACPLMPDFLRSPVVDLATNPATGLTPDNWGSVNITQTTAVLH